MDIDEILSFEYTEKTGENATSFDLNDVPAHKREKFRRFKTTNEGTHNGKWVNEEKLREDDNERLFGSIASQLDLTSYQQEEAKREYMRTNFKQIQQEIAIFCVCALIVREDGRKWSQDPLFLRFSVEQGYSQDELMKCMTIVSDKLER